MYTYSKSKSAVNKYIWDNPKSGPGIFKYEFVSAFIKDNIRARKKVNIDIFLCEMISTHQKRWNEYVEKVAIEDCCSIGVANKKMRNRLLAAYYGIYGEAILEGLISKSANFELIPLEEGEDHSSHIDLKIRCKHTNEIILIQVKTMGYYNTTDPEKLGVLEKEHKVHKEKNITVHYVYYNHKFEERHYIINNQVFTVAGYGQDKQNKHLFELESFLYELLEKNRLIRKSIQYEFSF